MALGSNDLASSDAEVVVEAGAVTDAGVFILPLVGAFQLFRSHYLNYLLRKDVMSQQHYYLRRWSASAALTASPISFAMS